MHSGGIAQSCYSAKLELGSGTDIEWKPLGGRKWERGGRDVCRGYLCSPREGSVVRVKTRGPIHDAI
jgi:hypothetical protein